MIWVSRKTKTQIRKPDKGIGDSGERKRRKWVWVFHRGLAGEVRRQGRQIGRAHV